MLVSQMPLFFLVVPHHADIILLGNKTKWEGKKKKKNSFQDFAVYFQPYIQD